MSDKGLSLREVIVSLGMEWNDPTAGQHVPRGKWMSPLPSSGVVHSFILQTHTERLLPPAANKTDEVHPFPGVPVSRGMVGIYKHT